MRASGWSWGFAVLGACASKPVHQAGIDSAPGDVFAASSTGSDAAKVGDGRLADYASVPSPSATGELPPGWTSILPVGTPGWRQTPTPLCDVDQGWAMSFTEGLWADSRGVFVVGAKSCPWDAPPLVGCPNDGQYHDSTILAFNDGSGWRTLFDGSVDTLAWDNDVSGIPDGPVVLAGTRCGINEFDARTGQPSCWNEEELSYSGLKKIFIANAATVYAIADTTFFDLRAGAIVQHAGEPSEKLGAVWGTEDVAYLASDYRLYRWSRANPSRLVPLANAPTGAYTAAWGFGENDVWFGNSLGQLVHYDGTDFAILQASKPEREGITRLWGQGDALYFSSATEFGRIADGHAQTLLTTSPPSQHRSTGGLTGMWGTSATDVFLVLAGAGDEDTPPCRSSSAFWFDGQALHQL
jgi:hypothetical protein